MPRVNVQTKSDRGADRFCETCGRKIQAGEKYHRWDFRYGGAHFSCKDHPPKPSQLTQSRMSEVYHEQEMMDLSAAASADDLKDMVHQLAEVVETVAGEYRDAAEAFGGAGENAERADELDNWVSDLQNFEPEEPEPEVDVDAIKEKMREDGFTEEDEAEWTSVLEVRVAEAEEAAGQDPNNDDDPLADLRSEAQELIDGCPL